MKHLFSNWAVKPAVRMKRLCSACVWKAARVKSALFWPCLCGNGGLYFKIGENSNNNPYSQWWNKIWTTTQKLLSISIQIRSFSLIQQSKFASQRTVFHLMSVCCSRSLYQEGEETSFGFKPVILLEWRKINHRGRWKLVYVRNRAAVLRSCK